MFAGETEIAYTVLGLGCHKHASQCGQNRLDISKTSGADVKLGGGDGIAAVRMMDYGVPSCHNHVGAWTITGRGSER